MLKHLHESSKQLGKGTRIIIWRTKTAHAHTHTHTHTHMRTHMYAYTHTHSFNVVSSFELFCSAFSHLPCGSSATILHSLHEVYLSCLGFTMYVVVRILHTLSQVRDGCLLGTIHTLGRLYALLVILIVISDQVIVFLISY